jgi:4-amino-4-deoxy-L-arabinose transferase-like glycosyltransferase
VSSHLYSEFKFMQNTSRRQVLLLFAIIFWILFVLGGYYYFHKPVNIEMIAPPVSALVDLVFVCGFTGLAGGLGRLLLKAEDIPPLERAALQFSVGAGGFSLLWLILGVLGLYHLSLGGLVFVIAFALLWKPALAWYRSFAVLRQAWEQAGGLAKGLAILGGVLVMYQLLIALAPPVKWDALAYHLQLPRQYLAAGRLVFIPENPYWGHPQLVEMLYTFAMSFHRAETAALLGWSAGVIFLLGLMGFTNNQLRQLKGEELVCSSSAGWMAMTAVLAGYTFRYLLGWSYTDLFSALFGLAALIAFFYWLDTARPAWLLWAGVACGLALGTKWTAGVLALGIFTAALVFRKQGQLALKTWLLAGILAFLVIVPWLSKNWIATGSPFYPYMIGTTWFDSARLASANLPPESIDWWQHLLLPISTTWAGVDSAAGFSTDLGPLLLLFAAPGFWLYRRSPKIQTFAILLGFTALGLGVASLRYEHLIQTRLYFATLACLAVPAGWGWDWLQSQVIQGVRLRRILSAAALLVMGLLFWQDTYFIGQITPGRVSLGTQTRQAYLENNVGYHIRAAQTLKALPAGSRILMLWEPRGYYTPLNTQADLWIDRWRTDQRELGTAPAILARWKNQGFTHLLVYQPGIELIRPQPGQAPSENWTALQDLLGMLPSSSSIGDNYELYQLR